MITGLNCPGCGTARGLHQLLHGNFVAAFEFNPLLVILLPIAGYFLFTYTRSAVTGRPLPHFSISTKYAWIMTGIIFGFWVFRNTTYYPFVF